MSKLRVVDVNNLGGGVNVYNFPDQIAPSETTDKARNFRGDAEAFTFRKGYQTYFDTLSGNAGVDLLVKQSGLTPAEDRVLALQNNKIYRGAITDNALAEVTQSALTVTSGVNAVTNNNEVYLYNGINKPVRIVGTTVTQPFTEPDTVLEAAFLPKFGEIYNGIQWVGGVPSTPNVLYASRTAVATNPEYIYDFSGSTSTTGDADQFLFSSRVTAVKSMTSALIVFTEDGAHSFTQPQAQQVDIGGTVSEVLVYKSSPVPNSGGTVNQRTVCQVENDVWYLTPRKEIRSIKRDISTSDIPVFTETISAKIQKYLDKMDDDQSKAHMYYDQAKRLFYFYFTLKGEVYPRVRVVGDYNKLDQSGAPAWYIDDNVPFTAGLIYKDKILVGSAFNGQLWEDGVGLADDDDANIQGTRPTKDFTANNPNTKKRWRYVDIFGEMTPETILYIDIYVDDRLIHTETASIDTLVLSTSTLGGGIGTQSVGDFPVGEEVSEATGRFEYTKRIPLRQAGYKMRLDFRVEGTQNDVYPRHLRYGFVALGDLFYPVKERS